MNVIYHKFAKNDGLIIAANIIPTIGNTKIPEILCADFIVLVLMETIIPNIVFKIEIKGLNMNTRSQKVTSPNMIMGACGGTWT